MEKINLVELLRNCPSGMELDCAVFDHARLEKINSEEDRDYPIQVNTLGGCTMSLTKYGTYIDSPEAKCVIFPKGKTTWEGFVPPYQFKNGDILYCNANDDGENKDMFKYIFIFDKIVDVDGTQFYYSHCHLFGNEFYDTNVNLVHNYSVRFATKEEKQKLFQAIKDNGYKWNSETKTLENLIEPKFKVGDRIKNIRTCQIHTVTDIYGDEHISFQVDYSGYEISYKFQDEYELVPNKFDINTFKPLQPVLVRNTNGQVWTMDLFSHKIDTNKRLQTSFVCVGHCPNQCIPYEGNEHLRGTADDCDEFYRTWEKNGD